MVDPSGDGEQHNGETRVTKEKEGNMRRWEGRQYEEVGRYEGGTGQVSACVYSCFRSMGGGI